MHSDGQPKSEQARQSGSRPTGLFENVGLDVHLLGKRLAALETLHQAATDIVLAVPLDLLARLAVKDEPDRELSVLVHLTRDVVAPAELVAEADARVVE